MFPTPTKLSTRPAFGPGEATDRMLASFPSRSEELPAGIELPAPEADLVVRYTDGQPRLVYAGTVSPSAHEQYRIFLDAHTGEEIGRYSTVCRLDRVGDEHHGHAHTQASAKRTARGDHPEVHRSPARGAAAVLPASATPTTAQATDLNGVTRTLDVWQQGGEFALVDASRPMWNPASRVTQDIRGGIVTMDQRNVPADEDGRVQFYYIANGDNRWDDPAAVSAHYNSGRAYEYFRQTFGRNSIDGQGGTIISVVNVPDPDGNGLDNAFWGNNIMWYGNGDVAARPLAGALDVGGHEMTHGVIQNTANLEYQDESGALNEHFADVFAVMIDRDDWTLGEDVMNREFYPTGNLRDMADPTNGGDVPGNNGYQPATYDERYVGDRDNGGVHINSGIGNNVCYRIAQAIGREATEQLYYSVLTDYLTRNSDYADYRAALEQRAEQQWGAGSDELAAVVAALDAVGIPGGAAPGGGNPGTPGQGDPGPDLEVNPGDPLVAYLNGSEELMPLATLTGDILIDDITPNYLPLTRASVSDDGSLAMMVSQCCFAGNQGGDIVLSAIDYATSTVRQDTVSGDLTGDGIGDIRKAVLSRDGSRFAFLLDGDLQDENVYVADLSGAEARTQAFRLYTPSTEAGPLYTVQYADAMEFDFSGEYLVYDALNEISTPGGSSIRNWDIGIIHVYDAATGGFADGEVQKLFGSLEQGVNVGNPTLAKTNPDVIAFDYFAEAGVDADEAVNSVIAINVRTNEQQVVWNNVKLGWPSFTPDDSAILFSGSAGEEENAIGIIDVGADKLTPQGDARVLLTDASRAVAFANGVRDLTPEEDDEGDPTSVYEVLGGAPWSVSPNPTSGFIDVWRNAAADLGPAPFEVFDNDGRRVATFPVERQRIDLTFLPAGIYVLRQGDRSKQVVRR